MTPLLVLQSAESGRAPTGSLSFARKKRAMSGAPNDKRRRLRLDLDEECGKGGKDISLAP